MNKVIFVSLVSVLVAAAVCNPLYALEPREPVLRSTAVVKKTSSPAAEEPSRITLSAAAEIATPCLPAPDLSKFQIWDPREQTQRLAKCITASIVSFGDSSNILIPIIVDYYYAGFLPLPSDEQVVAAFTSQLYLSPAGAPHRAWCTKSPFPPFTIDGRTWLAPSGLNPIYTNPYNPTPPILSVMAKHGGISMYGYGYGSVTAHYMIDISKNNNNHNHNNPNQCVCLELQNIGMNTQEVIVPSTGLRYDELSHSIVVDSKGSLSEAGRRELKAKIKNKKESLITDQPDNSPVATTAASAAIATPQNK